MIPLYQNHRPYMAQRVGFEPTVPLLVHLISSQGRYNHFDTAASCISNGLPAHRRERGPCRKRRKSVDMEPLKSVDISRNPVIPTLSAVT